MTTASDNIYPKVILVEGAAPSNPAATNFKLYVDSADSLLKYKNSAGAVTILGAGMANVLTTTGDVIYSSSGTTAARRGIGSTGDVLTVTGGVPVWAAPTGGTALVAGRVALTSGDLTTTSTTFVDATGVTLTLTTGAHRVLVAFAGMYSNSSTTAQTIFDVAVDGTPLGGTHGLAGGLTPTANKLWNGSFSIMTVALTAASHTIKLQWRVDAGTATLYASSVAPASFSVVELAM